MLWTRLCRIGPSHRLKCWTYLAIPKTLCSHSSSIQPKEGLSGPFPLKYDSNEVECGWYDWWKTRGYFQPCPTSEEAPFTLLLPPPNVTGILHLGHALSTTIQDAIVRRKRMQGFNVSWMPGSDHAGIATQVVVEKILAKKGVSRHALGREKFLDEVWKWKHEKGGVIFEQLARLGASLDWNRTTFTMDQSHSEAVTEAFVRLFDKGLVYRALAPINWSPQLQSAISDIEVDHLSVEEKTAIQIPGCDQPVEFGVMFDVAYKLDGSEEEITISTTRPETILGDVAVAVHPNDERYSHLIGRHLVHPFRSDTIPIIADTYVDPQFGTGALKITPAHDANDFEIGRRHDLPIFEIMDRNGSIANSKSDFDGLSRFAARERIIEELKTRDLFRGSKSHSMQIPICSRTGDVVEKLVQPQWFIDCDQMAANAMSVAADGQLVFHPTSYHNVWKHWLENIRDWCVSRQVWWGHRIPVWKAHVKGQEDHWIAARNESEARTKAEIHFQSKEVVLSQEEDVLDTWFSSAILPFANLGWPQMLLYFQESNEKGFPNSMLETGHDILFFWVARMVMLSLELTSKVPFPEVLLHGVVCDSQGRKMSKSLGNVIDPLVLMQGTTLEKMCLQIRTANANGTIDDKEMSKALEATVKDYPEGIPVAGADGLRFFFFVYDIKAQHINADTTILRSSSSFCNKIWQASRFLVGSLDRSPQLIPWKMEPYLAQNRWILSRLAVTVREVNEHFDSYDFYLSSQALRRFMYTNLCDVYLESIKHILIDPAHPDFRETASVLHQALISGLTLLHPICPFITEELYHRIPLLEGEVRSESMMIQSYPSYCDFEHYEDSNLMSEMEVALDLVTAIRDQKKNYDLKRHHKPKIIIQYSKSNVHGGLLELKDIIIQLCQIEAITWAKDVSNLDPKCFIKSSIDRDTWIWMDVQGMLDLEKEFVKLTAKRNQIRKQLEKLTKKLSSRKNHAKQAKDMDKVALLEQTLVELDDREAWLKAFK
ncbi:valine--tRNA ligase-like isoform X1 [Tigriopus californicus]|uniref:valine--tRNA ligase-like isoform X1 n=1 Tax=Tigriopus californicus TaxID=6832 RepID=UPI0027D9DB89|nr:valine--tRNA ligase-like isoform X1 [Tigriopus californicus]